MGQGSQQLSPAPRATESPQVLYNNYPDPTPTPWVSAVPTPVYTQPPHYPPVIPPPDYVDLKIPDPLGYQNYFCEPLPKSPILKYPTDVAVTADGKTVYAINSGCNRNIQFGLFLEDLIPECKNSYMASSSLLKRQLLFRIQNSKAEQLFQAAQQNLNCMMGSDLEIDASNQLYLVNQNQNQIERLSSDFQQKIMISAEKSQSDGLKQEERAAYYASPQGLQINAGHLFFQLQNALSVRDYHLRKMDLATGKHVDLISVTGSDSNITPVQTYAFGKIYQLFSKKPPLANWVKTDNIYTVQGLSEWDENLFSEGKVPTSRVIYFKQTSAPLIQLYELRAASADLFYLSDVKNHQIWVIRLNPDHSEGSLTVLAGSGQKGYQDGQGTAASFYVPTALSLDGAGNLYVADTGNHAIRKITPGGTVSTVYKAPESE